MQEVENVPTCLGVEGGGWRVEDGFGFQKLARLDGDSVAGSTGMQFMLSLVAVSG